MGYIYIYYHIVISRALLIPRFVALILLCTVGLLQRIGNARAIEQTAPEGRTAAE